MKPIQLRTSVNRALGGFHGRSHDIKLGTQLARVWIQVVGEPLARFCFPVDIRGKILTIGVISSVWMAELEYHRDTLIENLARHMGSKAITGIKYRMMPAAPRKGAPVPAAAPVKPPPPFELTAAQDEQLTRDLEQIADPELREQMRRVLTKALGLRA